MRTLAYAQFSVWGAGSEAQCRSFELAASRARLGCYVLLDAWCICDACEPQIERFRDFFVSRFKPNTRKWRHVQPETVGSLSCHLRGDENESDESSEGVVYHYRGACRDRNRGCAELGAWRNPRRCV